MKRKIAFFLTTIIVAVFAFNAVVYFTFCGRIDLAKINCDLMHDGNEDALFVARRVAAKIVNRPAYVYAISYFLVYSNMKAFWTKPMIVDLTNCRE